MNEQERWINAYLDGHLQGEEFEKFEDWLRADEQNREIFIAWAFDDRATYDQLAAHIPAADLPSVGHAVRDKQPDNLTSDPGREASPTPRSKSLLDRASRHPLIPSIGVAVVVVVALVLGLAFTPMKEWIAGGEGRERKAAAEKEYVAILNGRKDVKWLEGTRPSLSDPRLAIGQRLVLAKGAIEVKYDTGVRVVIEGPAEFTVGGQKSGARGRESEGNSRGRKPADANSGFLKLGKLVARVEGEKAQGFTINTPSGRVRDLGTEFGVEVQDDGASKFVVLSGKVDVIRDSSDGRPEQRVRLVKDQGASVEAKSDSIRRIANVDSGYILALRARLDEAIPTSTSLGATTLPPPDGFRAIAVVNHSFEHDRIPDGKFGTTREEQPAGWQTPFGWQWTDGVPQFGGLCNPTESHIRYVGTAGDGANGTMDGGQIAFLDVGVRPETGLQQSLGEVFSAGTSYELHVAAGARGDVRQMQLNGIVRLLAGDHVLASKTLPPHEPGQFRDYVFRYRYKQTDDAHVGKPLMIQLLRGPEREGFAHYDNIRLYAKSLNTDLSGEDQNKEDTNTKNLRDSNSDEAIEGK